MTGTPVQASAITLNGSPTELGNHFPLTVLVSDSSSPAQYNSITYYIDILPAGNPPAEIVADASQPGAAMTKDQLGANASNTDMVSIDTNYLPLLSGAGLAMLRWPGGIISDYYHWQTNVYGSCNPYGLGAATSFDSWMQAITAPLSVDAAITVNYGTNAACTGPGDPNEAAAWVNYANNTQHYGVKLWTVGNEMYSSSSPDLDPAPHDPTTYANRVATLFYPLMKAQDSTIMVGVDMDFGNQVFNVSTDDWDQIVLAQAKYDFVEMHYYPESGAVTAAADMQLLTTSSNQLAANFAMANAMLALNNHPGIPIYLGEFDRTSGGSSGSPGHESTSVVDALFTAVVLGEATKAGVPMITSWTSVDRCSPDSLNSAVSSAYGWQNFGSWGLFANGEAGFTAGSVNYPSCPSQGIPAYTVFPKGRVYQLLSQYILPGEHVIASASTDSSIRVYAATNKGGYALLLINTDETSTHDLPVTITNAGGSSYSAITLTYGKAQYDLSQSGTWAGAVSGNLGTVGTNFTVSLPPWSVTLVQLH